MLDRLCKMLDDGDAELQIAVARVLRELKPKDAAARKSLAGALKSQNDTVRLYALEALAAVDPAAALPHAVPLLAGPDLLRARAVQLFLAAGKASAPVLQDHLDAKDPVVRKGILEILGKLPGVDVTDTLFAGLLDPDPEVVKKAAHAYRERIESMPSADKAKALKRILAFMESGKVQKAKTALGPCLLVVGAMRDPSALKTVLKHLDRKLPPPVRNHALLALGSLPLEGKAGQEATAKLLPLLEEEDFNMIVKPALDVLWKLPPSKAHADRLMKLQKTGGPAVKAYAVKALGAVGSADAGDALLDALKGDDPRLADTAGQALRTNADYIPLLAKALEKHPLERQEDVAKAFRIVGILTGYKNVLDKALVKRFLARALAMLEKKESGFQAFFEVARSAAPDLARDAVLDKGRALLKKGKFEDAERTLRLVQRDDLATTESDVALATAQLRQQHLDVAGASRDQGPGVQLIQKAARRDAKGLLKELERGAG
ncbi:MAG TPA: HEAT repeat domain-containing protein, partial [Planctomycetota bacterium]|nr:HEAT repeat domain-containing protein [Planctomycetota bacterium]